MSISTAAASNYHDVNGLAALRRQAGRDAAAALEPAARQFESIFLQMMLKSMRSASMGDPLFDSNATRSYRDMFDQQLAASLSEQGSLGIADLLVRQLGGTVGRTDPASLPSAPAAPEAPAAANAPTLPVAPATLPRAATPTVPGPSDAAARPGATADAAPAPRASAAEDAPSAPRADAAEPEAFADQEHFLAALRPHAEHAARRLGVPADLLLAQAALETGWGRSVIRRPDGSSSHNLFGIKADSRWDGPRAVVSTLEYEGGIPVRRQAPFRAYGSFAESFQDYASFVLGSARYDQAVASAKDPAAYMRGLQQAGYATDPAYAEKVLRIWRETAAPEPALREAAADTTGKTQA